MKPETNYQSGYEEANLTEKEMNTIRGGKSGGGGVDPDDDDILIPD